MRTNNPSLKKPFSLMIESSEDPATEFYTPSLRKQVKKALTIDIFDSFADPLNPSLKQYSHLQPSPSLAHKLPEFPQLTPKNSKRSSGFFSSETSLFSLSPELERGRFFQSAAVTNDYDDYYIKGSFYDVSMSKCHRKSMEDRTTIDPELPENILNDKFFGIYDGHTSSDVSDFLQQNFHNLVASHKSFPEDPELALKESFQRIDKQILETRDIRGGSTALCALFRGKKLYMANAGDSKAVLVGKNEIKDITTEHRASNEEEKLRVESQGGVIIIHKSRTLVQGSLEITRSIGDRKYKKYISCEPDIFEHEITRDDQLVIMATDGFWDVMSNQEVMQIIKMNELQTTGLSKILLEAALKKRNYGLDNISLVVLYLSELVQTD